MSPISRLSLSHLPGYDELLELGRSRDNSTYLDLGCLCNVIRGYHHPRAQLINIQTVGVDIRKAIADGYPMKNVKATDLAPGTCMLTPQFRFHTLVTQSASRVLATRSQTVQHHQGHITRTLSRRRCIRPRYPRNCQAGLHPAHYGTARPSIPHLSQPAPWPRLRCQHMCRIPLF